MKRPNFDRALAIAPRLFVPFDAPKRAHLIAPGEPLPDEGGFLTSSAATAFLIECRVAWVRLSH